MMRAPKNKVTVTTVWNTGETVDIYRIVRLIKNYNFNWHINDDNRANLFDTFIFGPLEEYFGAISFFFGPRIQTLPIRCETGQVGVDYITVGRKAQI